MDFEPETYLTETKSARPSRDHPCIPLPPCGASTAIEFSTTSQCTHPCTPHTQRNGQPRRAKEHSIRLLFMVVPPTAPSPSVPQNRRLLFLVNSHLPPILDAQPGPPVQKAQKSPSFTLAEIVRDESWCETIVFPTLASTQPLSPAIAAVPTEARIDPVPLSARRFAPYIAVSRPPLLQQSNHRIQHVLSPPLTLTHDRSDPALSN